MRRSPDSCSRNEVRLRSLAPAIAWLAFASCHTDVVFIEGEGDDVEIDCMSCDPDQGCTPVPDGTPCATGICSEGDCVATSCDVRALWLSVGAGEAHSCAIDLAGAAWCWGRNAEGQLGLGTTEPSMVPSFVPGTSDLLAATAGGRFSCAVDRAGDATCWGKNSEGQLGAGMISAFEDSPGRVGDPTAAWRLVDAGENHACGIDDEGGLSCWGRNADGQLGVDGIPRSPAPVAVDSSSGKLWRDAAAGTKHSCAIDWDGELWCWGTNGDGQLGTGDTASRDAPTQVGTERSWIHVAAGASHTCAIDSGGDLWCWGDNRDGELGIGDKADPVTSPRAVVANHGWQRLALGDRFSCGIADNRTLWCWGRNDHGQLGAGSGSQTIPQQVGSIGDWAAIAAGRQHACAIRSLGALHCWGSNREGQLGLDDLEDRDAPSEVCADLSVN